MSSAPSPSKPRRRAKLACTACNKRKSRCDASELGLPCTNCKRLSRNCEMLQSRRGKYDRGSIGLTSKTKQNTTSKGVDSNSTSTNTNNSVDPQHQIPQHPIPLQQASSSHKLSQDQTTIATTIPNNNHNDSQQQHTDEDGKMVLDGAEIFVDFVTQASQRSVTIHDSRRIVYLPEASTYGYLVSPVVKDIGNRCHFSYRPPSASASSSSNTAPSTSSSAGPGSSSESCSSSSTSSRNHYPQTHRRIPFVEPAERDYLRKIGCFDKVDRNLETLLFTIYFRHAYNTNPVLDEVTFAKHYKNETIPWVLYWSVLFAATVFCDEQDLIKYGYTSHKQAIQTFYERSRALLDLEYDVDQITMIQAMILLSHHWNTPTDIRADAHHWIGVASSLAQACGMHRATVALSMDESEKRLWKRVWWSCVIRDRITGIGMGRPYRIQLEFCDIELLTLQDFEISDDILQSLPFKIASSTHERKLQVLYFIEMTKLSILCTEVMNAETAILSHDAPKSAMALLQGPQDVYARRRRCLQMLYDWKDNLPVELRLVDTTSYTEWGIYLAMAYHVFISRLYRHHSETDEEKQLPSQSASSIAHLFEYLLEHNMVDSLPWHANTAAFSAIAQHAIDLKRSQNNVQKQVIQNRLDTCIMAANELRRFQKSSTWFLNVFYYIQNLQERQEQNPYSNPAMNGNDKRHSNNTHNNNNNNSNNNNSVNGHNFASPNQSFFRLFDLVTDNYDNIFNPAHHNSPIPIIDWAHPGDPLQFDMNPEYIHHQHHIPRQTPIVHNNNSFPST